MSYHRNLLASPGRARGTGGAMGDVPGTSAVAELVRQVNRFGPGAPAGYQIVATPVLASGNIDLALAVPALTIYQRRATDSYNQFHDAGSAAAIASANQGFADPVAFVTGNLSDVLTSVTQLANALGLPDPSAGGGAASLMDGGPNMLLVAAGLGLLLWVLR